MVVTRESVKSALRLPTEVLGHKCASSVDREMRLLSTSTFELESFFDEERIPRYAILSHRWEGEEITLQELQQKDVIILLRSTKMQVVNGEPLCCFQNIKKGLLKIIGCALQAEKDGIGHIWCDTGCIDKTNSTELSEAINSMFHWYKDQLCYAYLGDVPHAGHHISTEGGSAFAESLWFTRGWTLQELIAPSRVVFFDRTWQSIGTRSGFKDSIAEITGIDREVLDGGDPALYSIAKRMSWASKRKTTRVEDIAYCLMGLFGVNMPLIYGERYKAFIRLQTEIMKYSDDQSLFAWKIPTAVDNIRCGLLASSPACFAESRNISPFSRHASDYESQAPFSMTSRGVSISLPILQVKCAPWDPKEYSGMFLATLDCQDVTDARGPLGVYLLRNEGGYYRRCYPHQLISAGNVQDVIGNIRTNNIYIAQDDIAPKAGANSVYRFHVPDLSEELLQRNMILKLFENKKIASWDPRDRILCCSQGLGASIYIGLREGPGKIFLIGIDSRLSARCIFDDAPDWWYRAFGLAPMNRLPLAHTLLLYRSGFPGSSGAHQKLLDKLLADEKEHVSGVEDAIKILKYKKDKDGSLDWDQWASRWDATSALLELGIWTSSKKTTFFRSKNKKVNTRVNLRINSTLEDEVINGQRRFLVRFEIQDWKREVTIGNESELPQGFHDFYYPENAASENNYIVLYPQRPVAVPRTAPTARPGAILRGTA